MSIWQDLYLWVELLLFARRYDKNREQSEIKLLQSLLLFDSLPINGKHPKKTPECVIKILIFKPSSGVLLPSAEEILICQNFQ